MILQKAIHEASSSSRIDIVFDVYNKNSIKNIERCLQQSASGSVEYKNIKSKQIVVQWRKFLFSTRNKTSLIQFLINEWKQHRHVERLNRRSLFVTCNETCYWIDAQGCKAIPELESTQDMCILLHSVHAAFCGFREVVIVSDDTDVFLLLKDITASLFWKSKIQVRMKCIKIQSNTVGEPVCTAIMECTVLLVVIQSAHLLDMEN